MIDIFEKYAPRWRSAVRAYARAVWNDGDDHADSKLVKPLENAKRIMYRLRRPDGRIYGTGSSTGSFWNTPQEALAAKKKSGIKDLMIYEYDTQQGEFRGEVMID